MFIFGDIGLRPMEREDLDFLREMHNDHSTIKNLTDIHMVNEIEQDGWFESVCRSGSKERLVVVHAEHGFRIGCVRLDQIDRTNRSILVGGDICSLNRGRGYGTKMFAACLKYCFDYLNMHRAYLSVLETNEVAIKLYQKFGFIEEGRQREAIFRDGKYVDYIDMGLLREEYTSDIAPLVETIERENSEN